MMGKGSASYLNIMIITMLQKNFDIFGKWFTENMLKTNKYDFDAVWPAKLSCRLCKKREAKYVSLI